jgi:hypothetical protein
MTNFEDYKIPLSMERPVQTTDDPSETETAFLEVSADAETGETPEQWVWLEFFAQDEPWFKLTFAETAQLRDALNKTLEIYDTLTDAQKADINS